MKPGLLFSGNQDLPALVSGFFKPGQKGRVPKLLFARPPKKNPDF
jgi:hypothetical protein